MKNWIVHWDAGLAGTDCYESCIAETKEEAEAMFEDDMYNWFDSFDQTQGYEEGSEEQREDEEERKSELSAYAEEYDPELHDGFRMTGQKWAWE